MKCPQSEQIIWYFNQFDTATILLYIRNNYPQSNLKEFILRTVDEWDLQPEQRCDNNMEKLVAYIELFKEFLQELPN